MTLGFPNQATTQRHVEGRSPLRSCEFSSWVWPVLHRTGSRPCKRCLSDARLRQVCLEQQRQAGSRLTVAQPARPFRIPLLPARRPSRPRPSRDASHRVHCSPDARQDPVPLHVLLPLLSMPCLPVFLFNLASALQSLTPSSSDTSKKPSFPPPSPRGSVMAPSSSLTSLPVLPCHVVICFSVVLIFPGPVRASECGLLCVHLPLISVSLGSQAQHGVGHRLSCQSKAGEHRSKRERETRKIRAKYTVAGSQLNKSPNPAMQKESLSLSTAIDRPKCTRRQMFV